MFSTSCHYGLQGILHIAYHHDEDRNIDLKQIAEEQNIPKHFLSKILQILVKKNLLVSTKGPSGGFRLKREPEEISLIEIIDAIDGMDVFTKCGIGFKQCNDDNPCPIHEDYKKVRKQVQLLFENKNLAELVEDSKQGKSIINLSMA
jgi:Rrf2 family iron-sulfur cluster assembly transcriptional regulator